MGNSWATENFSQIKRIAKNVFSEFGYIQQSFNNLMYFLIIICLHIRYSEEF